MKLSTDTAPKRPILYEKIGESLIKKEYEIDYIIFKDESEENAGYWIELMELSNNQFFISYLYDIENVNTTHVKQIHNNIICALDVYFDAIDMELDEHRKVCIHCDRVQVFSDFVISINNSNKASFTPIRICSMPLVTGDTKGINKDIAIITVI